MPKRTPSKRTPVKKTLTGSRMSTRSATSSDAAGRSGHGQAGNAAATWSFFTSQVLCSEHSIDCGTTIRAYGSVFTWEWINEQCSAATIRSPACSLAGEFTAIGDERLTIRNKKLYCGTFEADPSEHIGRVLINGGDFYIIHGGRIGEELPNDVIGAPGVPFTRQEQCSLCAVDTGSGPKLSDIEEVDTPEVVNRDSVAVEEHAAPQLAGTPRSAAAASARVPHFPLRRREPINSPPRPTLVGPPTSSEWKDYWGTKYTKLQYGDYTVLRCRDMSVYASHTLTEEGAIEIYPDIPTKLRSLKLATASNPKACLYTHDDTGRVFATAGTQVFLITRARKMMVMRTPVIKTRTRLISGQCIYYWSTGWTPYYGENMRIGSVVTVGRKVGDFYYYAVVNGATQYFELNVSVHGLWKVDHHRNRAVEKANFTAYGLEIVKFKYNTMYRIVSVEGRVISSWTETNELDYMPWEFEYFALKRTVPATATMGCSPKLEEEIYKAGGL